jgi:hypothetical protein
MRPNITRHLRALRHSVASPSLFFFKSSIIRWLLLILLMGGSYWLFTGDYFRVSKITCENQQGKTCDEVVMAELGSHRGESIFAVHTKAIKNKLEKASPAYQEVVVLAKLPNLLSVTMRDKVDYANLKVASNSAVFLVDQNLLIVNKTDAPTRGIFTIIAENAQKYGVGDQITDETLVKTFDLVELLRKSYLQFDEITVSSPTMVIVTLPEGKRALFTTTRDLPRQVTSLQLILSKATIAKEPQEYDMRFDKPVLK